MRSARARKRSDHAHTCSTLWLGVPRVFLIAPRSYDARAFYLHRGEQRLRYEKLATSSVSWQAPEYPLKAGQLEYDRRYSKMHGMPVTGGRGFRGLKPLWYNGVPP